MGTSNAQDLTITPGNMNTTIDVHFAPQGDAVALGRTLLEHDLQEIDVDTAIVSGSSATNIQSLQLALSQIHLFPVTTPALNQTLIKSVSLVKHSRLYLNKQAKSCSQA